VEAENAANNLSLGAKLRYHLPLKVDQTFLILDLFLLIMARDELKGLSPEEKIKKLKELEKQKKKEIAEAQKMLKESESELTAKDEWQRRVPIPQVAIDGSGGLSAAEKEVLESHKGLKSEENESVVEKEKSVKEEVQEDLEEIASRQRIERAPEMMQSDYTAALSQQPMQNIYQEMKDIHRAVDEKGYISAAEGKKIEYLSAATEKKLEDIEAGNYSLTEELEQAAMLTKQIGSSLKSSYHRAKGTEYSS
tara:strand:- start:73 stop:825 length:753 start_codon:yes stop_codon:yes gene_type:complete